mmetsp:Transcript_10509/g.24029  ORF Transcript_10509/g.24029 Transcript_10509/m.24029 type:complete len:141 (-) Transcript_10509:109-531(-)
MGEIAGAHCNYRFLLRSRTDSGVPINYLLLSLLGQRSTILSNCLSSINDPAFSEAEGSQQEEAVQRAQVLQCLFVSFSTDHSVAADLLQQWSDKSPNSIETLDYMEEECSHIFAALQQSTLLMPPTQRMLNGLPVGFLPV